MISKDSWCVCASLRPGEYCPIHTRYDASFAEPPKSPPKPPENWQVERRNIEHPNDPVHRPAHYTQGKIEVIDFIEDQKLEYHLGNVVKYICRAGKKDPSKVVEDLEKARWYLDRKIKVLKGIKS